MSDTDPQTTPTSAVSQAEFLASARRKSMTPDSDPGAGPLVRCPRCRHEQRWDDLDKHMVMKAGDSAYRHCSNRDCSSIFSLDEGLEARELFRVNTGVPEPEPDGPDDGTRPEPGPEPEREPYETPSLTEINIGAADALIAHHAKELALKLLRVADSVVAEIPKVKSGGETRGLLDAIKYSLDLAGQADMLGDKAVLRTPILGLTPEWPANAKCLSCEHVFTTHFKHGIIRCPACDSNQDSGQARENHTRSC